MITAAPERLLALSIRALALIGFVMGVCALPALAVPLSNTGISSAEFSGNFCVPVASLAPQHFATGGNTSVIGTLTSSVWTGGLGCSPGIGLYAYEYQMALDVSPIVSADVRTLAVSAPLPATFVFSGMPSTSFFINGTGQGTPDPFPNSSDWNSGFNAFFPQELDWGFCSMNNNQQFCLGDGVIGHTQVVGAVFPEPPTMGDFAGVVDDENLSKGTVNALVPSPEPTALTLFLAGLLGLARLRGTGMSHKSRRVR